LQFFFGAGTPKKAAPRAGFISLDFPGFEGVLPMIFGNGLGRIGLTQPDSVRGEVRLAGISSGWDGRRSKPMPATETAIFQLEQA